MTTGFFLFSVFFVLVVIYYGFIWLIQPKPSLQISSLEEEAIWLETEFGLSTEEIKTIQVNRKLN